MFRRIILTFFVCCFLNLMLLAEASEAALIINPTPGSVSANVTSPSPESVSPDASTTTTDPEAVITQQAKAAPAIPASLIQMGKIHAKYERFYPKAWESPFPGYEDTLFPEAGGAREAMANHNFGLLFLDTSAIYYNLAQPPMYHFSPKEQVFMGQRPTFQSTEMSWLTYDVPHHHLQFIASYANINTNWDKSGPTLFRLDDMMVTWWGLKDKLDITFGYIENDSTNFYEGYIGGSLAGGTLGVQAAIPYIVGESRTGTSTPGLNIKYKLSNNFYNRLGFQRSVDPAGGNEEHTRNPKGWRFLETGARLLTIDEIGYHRHSSAGSKSVFVRATGWFNNSHFQDYRTLSLANVMSNSIGKTDNNFAASIAGDFQVTQPDKILAFRGWYAGGSAQYAPPQQNAYTQYYEGRFYSIGPFKSRPTDMAIAMVTHTSFSEILLDHMKALPSAFGPTYGVPTYPNQTSVSFGYSYHAHSGLWICPNVTYSHHPTFAPRLNDPVNAVMNFTWML